VPDACPFQLQADGYSLKVYIACIVLGMAIGDALLALMLPGPRHGYDLKRAHDEWFAGMRPLAFGQVYSTLSRLQRDGLAQVAHTESGDGPERVVYELTEEGRQRATEWLSEPVDPAGSHGEELIRKTLAAYRLNADPDGLMARQRTVHLRRIRALEPVAPGRASAELAPTLLDDHVRLHLDADLRWLEIAAGRIRRQPAQTPPPEPRASAEPAGSEEPAMAIAAAEQTKPIETAEPRAGGSPA
jgi:DNA-binding PadR family transcriptional regulator